MLIPSDRRRISVIVPALNEEDNITATCTAILRSLDDKFDDYEILLFNDGSTDSTGAIIDSMQKDNPRVKAVHHGRNRGLGYVYRAGVQKASMEYVVLIPGDNEYTQASISEMFDMVGKADIVNSYTVNMEVRPYKRMVLSRLYSLIISAMFNCNLHYYNGIVIHRSDLIKKVAMETNGFAYQTVALVKLIRSGSSFLEVATYLKPREGGMSTALRLKNVYRVLKNILRLSITIHITKRSRYKDFGQRIRPQSDDSPKE